MKDSILFVSTSNVPVIEYTGNQVTHKDFLRWREKLIDLGVDVMKIIVFANRDLFTAFQRSMLKEKIAVMEKSESLIPFTSNNKLPIEEQLEFAGFKIMADEDFIFDENRNVINEIIMKVFVYEVFNDYYLNKGG